MKFARSSKTRSSLHDTTKKWRQPRCANHKQCMPLGSRKTRKKEYHSPDTDIHSCFLATGPSTWNYFCKEMKWVLSKAFDTLDTNCLQKSHMPFAIMNKTLNKTNLLSGMQSHSFKSIIPQNKRSENTHPQIICRESEGRSGLWGNQGQMAWMEEGMWGNTSPYTITYKHNPHRWRTAALVNWLTLQYWLLDIIIPSYKCKLK